MKDLERSLGLSSVIAISISAMLGSGIFVLPGLAAAKTGSAVWVAYVLAGLCVLPAALCKAELSTAMPTSGGTYVYLDRLFGPLVGTVAGLGLWLSLLLKAAFALLGFGTYLIVLSDLPLRPTALVLLLGIVVLNILGVKKVGKVQLWVLVVTLVGLAVLVVGALSSGGVVTDRVPFSEGVGGLLASVGFVAVSYNGVTKVAAIAEEVKDPDRNLPLGIMLSLLITVTLYATLAYTLTRVVPVAELGADLKPIHTLTQRVGGKYAGAVAAVVGAVTLVSMANTGLLAASRFPFAMARDELLPDSLRSLHASFRTPVVAIIATGGAMAFAVVFLDVEKLAKLASAMVIALFIAENVAVVAFRESRVSWYKPRFRSPLYPWLQGLGVLSGLALLFGLGGVVLTGALFVVTPGVLLFLFYGRRRTKRLGVVGLRTRRSDLLQEPPSEAAPVSDHEESLPEAAVVVSLFGAERSPEMLSEVGAALAAGRRIMVVHLNEIPETLVMADFSRDPHVMSEERRIRAMAEDRGLSLDFMAGASRDLARSVHQVTNRVHCDWLVMEWRGQTRDTLMPYNPLGWLINHLSANLALFKDAGVRYVREILVFAEPGAHDALVIGTADHLAATWRARITLVRFVRDGSSPEAERSSKAYVAQLRQLCIEPTQELEVRGSNVVTAVANATAAYDLLVMGSPDVSLIGMLRGNAHDRIKNAAACSVLTVRTPRHRTHESVKRSDGAGGDRCYLPDFIAPGALGAGLDISKKDALFSHFARAFAGAFEDIPAKVILDGFWERERTQNTAVGHGVALPHATLEVAPRSLVGVFTTRHRVDYQGPDEQPVDVFFATIGPPSERHLHLLLLSGIARLTLQTSLLEQLRAAKSGEEMLEAIIAASAEVESG